MNLHHSKRNNFTILVLISILFLATNCTKNNEEKLNQAEELAALREQMKSNDLTVEKLEKAMGEVNTVLDSAANLNTSFKTGTNFQKGDALDKIRALHTELVNQNGKIDSLKTSLAKNNSKTTSNKLITQAIDKTQAELQTQQKYYAGLEKDVEKLRTQVVSLQAIIQQKEKDLLEKDDVILKIKAEREEQQRKLDETMAKIQAFESRIAQAEQEVERVKGEAKTQKATIFFEMGELLRTEVDNMPKGILGIGSGKATKKELIKQAYEYYKKAYQLGKPEGQRKMFELDGDEKYSKFLKEK
jgi:chromosome segregation ATPase